MNRWMRSRTAVLRSGCLPVGLALALAGGARAQGFDHGHTDFSAVLVAHVVSGRVDYAALKSAPGALDHYLNTVAAVREAEFAGWSEPQQLAYLFNLYNAATLRLILDHYPLQSIRDIGNVFRGPWDQPVVRLFGKTITLNNLEHDILRKEYDEPRLHMALVCAAKGCPPLRSEAYTAERLDAQLDDQSRRFLASPAGLWEDRARGEIHLSSIFKWYGKDFASVPDFVARHTGRSLDGLRIRYLAYDWSLNGR